MRRSVSFLCIDARRSGPGRRNNPFETKPDFLPVGKAFIFTSERLESGETQLYWQIADGYYLYQKRLKFDGLPAEQKPALPQGEATATSFSASSRSIARAWN